MNTVTWTKPDLGGGPPSTKDIPVDGAKCVNIPIPLAAYKRLAHWASIGRTIREAQRTADEDCASELEDLHNSLVEIHDAIRKHWVTLPRREA